VQVRYSQRWSHFYDPNHGLCFRHFVVSQGLENGAEVTVDREEKAWICLLPVGGTREAFAFERTETTAKKYYGLPEFCLSDLSLLSGP
jgi:hypothetical protein